MAILLAGTHRYGQDGFIWQVSDAAAEERQKNWHEIVGAAAGYAIVEHQDWKDLYAYFLETFPSEHYKNPWNYGPSYLVHVVKANGKAVHLGSFHARHGKIELEG